MSVKIFSPYRSTDEHAFCDFASQMTYSCDRQVNLRYFTIFPNRKNWQTNNVKGNDRILS